MRVSNKLTLITLFVFFTFYNYAQDKSEECFFEYEDCTSDAEGETLIAMNVIQVSKKEQDKKIAKFIQLMRECANNYYSCTGQ